MAARSHRHSGQRDRPKRGRRRRTAGAAGSSTGDQAPERITPAGRQVDRNRGEERLAGAVVKGRTRPKNARQRPPAQRPKGPPEVRQPGRQVDRNGREERPAGAVAKGKIRPERPPRIMTARSHRAAKGTAAGPQQRVRRPPQRGRRSSRNQFSRPKARNGSRPKPGRQVTPGRRRREARRAVAKGRTRPENARQRPPAQRPKGTPEARQPGRQVGRDGGEEKPAGAVAKGKIRPERPPRIMTARTRRRGFRAALGGSVKGSPPGARRQPQRGRLDAWNQFSRPQARSGSRPKPGRQVAPGRRRREARRGCCEGSKKAGS